MVSSLIHDAMSNAQQPVSEVTPKALYQQVESLASREGVILLETQTPQALGKCVLGQHPVAWVKGSLPQDLALLREAFERLKKEGSESAALVGYVGYDGAFVFGAYPELQITAAGDAHQASQSAPNESTQGLDFRPMMSKDMFCHRVEQVKAFIAAGDIYQVNLSYPWLAPWRRGGDFWPFYDELRRKSPAPYGAYLNLDGVEVASSSPECFIKIQDRHMVTRPIKGTRPRGKSEEEDAALAEELCSSSKERAELVMITDLERNDLGQVCEFGSVKVTELLKLEKYAQVQHLVSTVEGELRHDVDHFEALSKIFPGGSITGAPKKRAMEIIETCELGNRSLYTGAIGYFGVNGESTFSIAIRTAWKVGNIVRFDTGAGIVADSDPEKEWEETCHKAAGLLAVRI